jgi:hypothetical protein
MRLAGHISRMARRGINIGFWMESEMVTNHQEDLGVGGVIILE